MDNFERNDRLTTADIVNPRESTDQRIQQDERLDSALDDRTSVDRMERNDPGLTTAQVAAQANREDRVQSSPGNNATTKQMALFPEEELSNYRSRWDKVQTSFVDEPRKAVEDADSLVANVVKRLAEQFASERADLEKQWDNGGDVSTEDLRQGLRRYRAFFDRLLSV